MSIKILFVCFKGTLFIDVIIIEDLYSFCREHVQSVSFKFHLFTKKSVWHQNSFRYSSYKSNFYIHTFKSLLLGLVTMLGGGDKTFKHQKLVAYGNSSEPGLLEVFSANMISKITFVIYFKRKIFMKLRTWRAIGFFVRRARLFAAGYKNFKNCWDFVFFSAIDSYDLWCS